MTETGRLPPEDAATVVCPAPDDAGRGAADLRPWFLTLGDLPPAPLVVSPLFDRDQSLEIEVGTGRGLFLVNAGITRPETNFLGIEYDFKEARRAARRLQKRVLPNVRILGADARIVLGKYLSDG
jgi:tRNA (guanine-N7-)-methyltransferase